MVTAFILWPLLGNAQQTAKNILEANRAKLRLLADRLLLHETIEGAELRELLRGTPEEIATVA